MKPWGKRTDNHDLLDEKLFLGQTGSGTQAALLFIADPIFGPAIASASTPNIEDGAMLFGEIERRWNAHTELVGALRELHAEVERDSQFSGVSREMFGPLLARAGAILTRVDAEAATAGFENKRKLT